MRKILLAVFVVLLCGEHITSHNIIGSSNIQNYFDNFVTTLSSPLKFTTLSRISYNDFNAVTTQIIADLIAFLQPASSIFTTIPNGKILDKFHSCLADSFVSLANETSLVDDKILDYFESLSDKPLNQHNYSIASFAIALQLTSIGQVSYGIFSIGSILGGQNPNEPPFAGECPKHDLDTVHDQVKAFKSYKNILTNQLKDLADVYDALSQKVGGNCICSYAASVQQLIDAWNEISQEIHHKYGSKDCKKYTLGQYLSKSYSHKLAKVIDATRDFLKNSFGCIDCIIENSVNPSGNEIDQVCTASKNAQFLLILSKQSSYPIEAAYATEKYIINRIVAFNHDLYDFIQTEADFISYNANRMRSERRQKVLENYVESLKYFQRHLKRIVKDFLRVINPRISEWHDFTLNQTTQINGGIAQLVAAASINSELCQKCLTSGNFNTDQLDYGNSFKRCGKIVARGLGDVARRITNFIRGYLYEYDAIVKKAAKCIRNVDDKARCYDELAFAFSASCIEEVTARIFSTTDRVYADAEALVRETDARLDEITENYELCISSNAETAALSVNSVAIDFQSCATAAGMGPQVAELSNELNNLLALLSDPSANQNCTGPFKDQVSAAMLGLQQSGGSSITPEAIAGLLGGLQALLLQISTDAQACFPPAIEPPPQ